MHSESKQFAATAARGVEPTPSALRAPFSPSPPDAAPLALRRSAAELPLRYFDGTSVLCFFAVERGLADAQIDRRHFRLAMHWRRWAIVGMGFYEFASSTIGGYHEVGIAIPVLPIDKPGPKLDLASLVETLRPARTRRSGLCVLHLPVTTETARAAGADHWGYPKFVTSIAWRLGGREFDCAVDDPQSSAAPIVRLSGSLGLGVPVPSMDQVLYSRHDDRTLRTEIAIAGKSTVRVGSRLRLAIGASAHPMAATLRALGMEGARPLVVMHIRRFTSVLPAGVTE